MTKQEAIEKAWVDTGIDFEKIKPMLKIDESISYDMRQEGWVHFNMEFKQIEGYNHLLLDFISLKMCRPKSLKGIETNNGWLVVEQNGLPQNGTKCHFIISGFEENEYMGHYEDGLFWDGKAAYTAEIVTHYQPIIKPEPPIY